MSGAAKRDAFRRRALALVWVGEIWNLGEAAVALWSGLEAGSVALLAFGFDSLIELFVGGVLIWRLRRDWSGRAEEAAAERQALKLVGLTFFLLSAWILVQATGTLGGLFDQPNESLVGIGLVVASAVIMTVLYLGKMDVARKLGSRALRAEAIESLVCDLQDLTLLLGLGLNALIGWWWADPIAALGLIPFLAKEGWEAWQGEDED
jgi:divalent metal cation (Fe/Co/Zn/Cd) transporter